MYGGKEFWEASTRFESRERDVGRSGEVSSGPAQPATCPDIKITSELCHSHDAIPRTALHAWRLRAPHPTRQPEMLEVTAPLPEDLRKCLVAHGVEWVSP